MHPEDDTIKIRWSIRGISNVKVEQLYVHFFTRLHENCLIVSDNFTLCEIGAMEKYLQRAREVSFCSANSASHQTKLENLKNF